MHNFSILRAASIAFAVISFSSASAAQAPASADADTASYHDPVFATGITVGAVRFGGGRAEEALTVMLRYQPVSWLSLSAAPGFGRTTFGTVSSNGPTDIPLSASVGYSPDALPWSADLAASLSSTLSVGQPSSPLGVGGNAVFAGGWLRVSPIKKWHVSAGASRPLTTASGNASADLGISRSIGRATPSFGYSAELGRADSAATLARSLGGGVVFALTGPLSMAIDGSHGLSSGAPKWAFSLSFGTALGGLSPMNATSSFGRLKNAFGSRATSSSGYSKTASGTSCRKLGTC